MFNYERQEEIKGILAQIQSVSVAKLAVMLHVSEPTVRRDLTSLEEQGIVTRTHGGVMLRKAPDNQTPWLLRSCENPCIKKSIAEKAAEHIHNGDVIFLDASTTVTYLVPQLKRFTDIIAITNGPKISLALQECGIKNYCTGGMMLLHSLAYVGNQAEEFVSRINADLFFFSSRGYTENGIITDTSVEEATVKKAMIKNADRSFYLCDSSKKNKKYMYSICSIDEIDGLIDEYT